MKERLKVKDNELLERDTNTQAILSNNQNGYRAALAKRRYAADRKEEINNLNNKVDELTNLVHKLIEKIDK